MRSLRFCVSIGFAMLLVCGAVPRAYAADQLCFGETNQCVEGRFQQFWEANGGLPVFGLPIGPAHNEQNHDTRQTYLTQQFERNRFELHTENQTPYDVLLGRLGDDRLKQQGRDWHNEPQASGPQQGCVWFAETKHNVCDVGSGVGFATYWQGHGLADPKLNAYGRSLALFGLPLTEPQMETNSSGDNVLTQHFERARFEYHPDQPARYKVLLGLLGKEVQGKPAPEPKPINVAYLALGDSLAYGIFANNQQGYVNKYRDALQNDTSIPVELTNRGVIGWTSGDLLNALRNDQDLRGAVMQAGVVTWDIGGNDFAGARKAYKARTCGGGDNQNCFRSTAATFRANWDAILAELLQLRSPTSAVLRTMDVYNPYVGVDRAADTWADDGGLNDFQAFKPYVDAANVYIATTASAKNIPVAQVYAAYNGADGTDDPAAKGLIAFDGLHPNDRGHQVIADALQALGYAPLK